MGLILGGRSFIGRWGRGVRAGGGFEGGVGKHRYGVRVLFFATCWGTVIRGCFSFVVCFSKFYNWLFAPALLCIVVRVFTVIAKFQGVLRD